MLSRRSAGLSALAAIVAAAGIAVPAIQRATGSGTARAEAAPPTSARPVTPVMPAPAGSKRIGKIDLHLVDQTRDAPWPRAGVKEKRELMVSVYYPARDTAGHRHAPYMTPLIAKTADLYSTRYEFGLPTGSVNWSGVVTHAYENAPVERGRHPVLLYSTEHLRMRGYATAQAEDLASHGYIVVTTESTHEAFGVEFPTPDGRGRLESIRLGQGQNHPPDPRKMTQVRVADLRFVLDRLTDLNAGRNPDHARRPLPDGTRGAFDPRRIGVYGHVGGSVAGLEVMRVDSRVKAVAGLTDVIGSEKDDFAPVVHTGVDRPYMLLSTTEKNDSDEIGNRVADEGWAAFWPKLKGWKLNVQLQDSRWHALGDYMWLTHQIPGMEDRRAELVGTVRPDRALTSQNAYLNAFFDRHLRHRRNHILHRASTAHPDITFLP